VANDRPKEAWQPLTFGGVARFAVASRWRLLGVELFFALLVAATAVWFVQRAWVPVIEKAIQQMPLTGEIRGGRLAWPSEAVLLQEGPFMRIDVRPGGFTDIGVVESSDLVLAFGPSDLRVGSSLGLGLLTVPYPTGWILSFSKTELVPWWGARSHMVLAGFGLLVIWVLLCAWSVLGRLYMVPVKIFSVNQVSWAGAKKIAIAAQMPSVLVMTVGIGLYGMKQINLVALLVVWGVHLVLPWVYLMFSPILAPKPPKPKAKAKKTKAKRKTDDNPFDESSENSGNPFGSD
ncbi:uncharacterized protein METZ01_LOCUS277794, partial [marine metagenome]